MDFKALFTETMMRPMQAAQTIIDLGVKREVLWTALVLVALLNAIQFSLSFHLSAGVPPPDMPAEEQALFQFFISMAERPFIFTMFLASSLVISVFVLSWVGRMLGGQGALPEVLAVVTWWQVIGFAIGLVIWLLGFVALPIAGLLGIITNVWLLYAIAGLLAGAHRFGSPLGGLGTIVLSLLLLAIGLTFALVILGIGAGAGGANV